MFVQFGNPARAEVETFVKSLGIGFRLGGGGWTSGGVTSGPSQSRIFRAGDGTPALDNAWWRYGDDTTVRQRRLSNVENELRCIVPATFADVDVFQTGVMHHQARFRIMAADEDALWMAGIWRRDQSGELTFAIVTVEHNFGSGMKAQVPLILGGEECVEYLFSSGRSPYRPNPATSVPLSIQRLASVE